MTVFICDTVPSVITVKTISVKNEVIRDLNLHFNINLWLILHQYCLHMWNCLICDHSKDNFSEEWSHQRPNIYILIATYDLFFINIAFICDTVSSVIMLKTMKSSVENERCPSETFRDLNSHFNINLWLILHQYCLHMWYSLICDHDKDNFSEERSHQRPKFTF